MILSHELVHKRLGVVAGVVVTSAHTAAHSTEIAP